MVKFWQKLVKIASKNAIMKNDMRHFKPSLIYSQEDLQPSGFLIDLISSAIKIAWESKLICGKDNLPDSEFLNNYPGEHYRLLSAVVKLMRPSLVVEIGTWTGLGTLALASGLENGKINTFDVVDWDKLPVPSHFVNSDFENKNISQIIGDLSDDQIFEKYKSILNSADIIFMDAPKDGVFEYKLLKQLAKLDFKENKLLILDDIRFLNMIDLWRSIRSPKLDVSSFGHWSGTGLVDMSAGLDIR
jgi:hypothetical protein